MSKESGGFLRKVVRFVANPTTDWTELDTPSAEAAESQYAKSEIKAMIERKRRNDFVRKRELDMLRKIRREGLSPDNALALSGNSNIDSDSRPYTGTRSDLGVKAKIDEIEQQMVGGSQRPSTLPSRPANLPTLPMGDTVTTPTGLTMAVTQPLSLEEDVPQVSQAVLDAARASMQKVAFDDPMPIMGTLSPSFDAPPATSPFAAPLTAPMAPSGFQHGMAVHVTEVVHDPELDEAVIAFANADFDHCEQSLLALLHPGASRHDSQECWLVLFDFYRAVDLQQKFDQLAVSYAQKFGVSAPQWFSYPKKVAAFLATTSGDSAFRPIRQPPAVDHGPDTEPGADILEGWVAPPVLDADAIAQLRVELLQMPQPLTMDWGAVQRVTPEGAVQLEQMARQWGEQRQALVWSGLPNLMGVLNRHAATGQRDADPAYWMLRLTLLRLSNRPVEFDEAAIDYCITYERSPPSWEPALCTVREGNDAISPHSRTLSRVSGVSTSFVESVTHRDADYVQVAMLTLSGQLAGDIGATLQRLDEQLGASVALDIDCEHLLRVDFIAAGDLLNWVLARRAEGREVSFLNPHRLVAMFFGAMGINEHARVKLLSA